MALINPADFFNRTFCVAPLRGGEAKRNFSIFTAFTAEERTFCVAPLRVEAKRYLSFTPRPAAKAVLNICAASRGNKGGFFAFSMLQNGPQALQSHSKANNK